MLHVAIAAGAVAAGTAAGLKSFWLAALGREGAIAIGFAEAC
jgi:hypothetical protein